MQLDSPVAQLRYLAAQNVAVEPVLVWGVLVGVQRYSSVYFAVPQVSDIAFFVLLIVFIEQLLHLEERKEKLERPCESQPTQPPLGENPSSLAGAVNKPFLGLDTGCSNTSCYSRELRGLFLVNW